MLRAPILALFLAAPMALAPAVLSAQTPVPTPAQNSTQAEQSPDTAPLIAALRLYDLMAVLSAEGIAAADQMEADMFPGQGSAAWQAVVSRIYSTDQMIADMEAAFPTDIFTTDMLADLTTYFTTDPGAAIITAELEARRIFAQPDVEAAANEVYADSLAAENPRLDLLREFVAANDLLERNVMGALNSNFGFYQGLSDGNAFPAPMPEDLMLAEVWAQEPQIRADAEEWLYSFQLMAYDGISDADVQSYVDLSRTPAGQALNTALFTAFDAVLNRISYDLGQAAAVFVAGEEI
jgi:hypothetical protein